MRLRSRLAGFHLLCLLCLHAWTTQAFITALPLEFISRSSHIVNTKTRDVTNILPRTGRGTTTALVSLELAKSRSPRFGGRRQPKRRILETKSMRQPLDVNRKKFPLWLSLFLGGIALTQLLFGTSNPSSSSSSSSTFYYYESSIVQQNIEINGQVQTSRKESVRTNIPDIVLLRPGTGTDTEEGSLPSSSQQQQQKLKTIDSFDSMLLFDNMLQRFWNDEDY